MPERRGFRPTGGAGAGILFLSESGLAHFGLRTQLATAIADALIRKGNGRRVLNIKASQAVGILRGYTLILLAATCVSKHCHLIYNHLETGTLPSEGKAGIPRTPTTSPSGRHPLALGRRLNTFSSFTRSTALAGEWRYLHAIRRALGHSLCLCLKLETPEGRPPSIISGVTLFLTTRSCQRTLGTRFRMISSILMQLADFALVMPFQPVTPHNYPIIDIFPPPRCPLRHLLREPSTTRSSMTMSYTRGKVTR